MKDLFLACVIASILLLAFYLGRWSATRKSKKEVDRADWWKTSDEPPPWEPIDE